MKYNVHLYPVVRVKVCDIEADSQEQAIERAENLVYPELDPMFEHCIGDHVSDVQFADEIVYYLVDEQGDEEYQRSCWYEYHGGKLRNMERESEVPHETHS